MEVLEAELANKNRILEKLKAESGGLDKVIDEVESAFVHIMEASQSLLHTTRSLGTKLDSKYPVRELLANDPSRFAEYDARRMNAPLPPVLREEAPALPEAVTAEMLALHDTGFAPPSATPKRGGGGY